jgi:hypothetical protein
MLQIGFEDTTPAFKDNALNHMANVIGKIILYAGLKYMKVTS